MSAEHGENQPKESLPKIYYRLNVENGEVVGLDEWQKMGRLKKLADDYMAHEDLLQPIDQFEKLTNSLRRKHPVGQFFPNWSIPHTIDQFECF